MLVRDADIEDWPGIWAIVEPVIRAGDTFTWDPATTEEQARATWMSGPPSRTFVAIDGGPGGVIVGTAEIHPNQRGPGAHVVNGGYMVHPDHRGRGVGRALGEHVIAAATADGYHAMQFNAVAATNVASIELWRKLGFEILATIPNGFRHPTAGYVGLHVMYRSLRAGERDIDANESAMIEPTTVRIDTINVDAADPSSQARWWGEALGWTVRSDDGDEAVIAPRRESNDTVTELLFARVPEPKTVKNRIHLDLRPDDQSAEVARFEALGARRIDVGQSDTDSWVVLADPEGNEFCILQARPPAELSLRDSEPAP